jgi:DNA-binding Lrp family transcriptional regulator
VEQVIGDKSDYPLLESLVYGKGVSVNVQALTKALRKHRNTVRKRAQELFEHEVLERPFFPFIRLFREYPLLVLTESDLPYDDQVTKWFREDPHIFAALRSRHSSYNTLLILFHKDITSYELWREKLGVEGQFPLVAANLGRSSTSFHSNQLMIKYEPNAPVYLMEEELKAKGEVVTNGYKLDRLSFQIVKLLAEGKCIKLNESELSKQLGLHRGTVVRKTQELIDEEWISNPVCRFPGFFTPPNYVLGICKLEIKSNKEAFIQALRKDPHVTLALNTSQDEFSILLFAAFRNLDEELTWEVHNDLRFHGSIGKVDIHFYSLANIPDMFQRRIYLGIMDENFMYFRI